ncbi:carbon-nitrogen hydrolase family protein [Pigmentiphaga sp. GD03639]|uniref:carbon-nitrogen hydrolase family protein n=1 Tax=Pigmentiphaga sp. GD03639 TaxID=2975354 RepID=UPI0024495D75|nr:carbon-nitrogen hydrolase family protein [Pigmentiphaga sp. GD03639]MDH2237068.1 carbon-nitrogen hydrolase family protein [Pigmentiphaga sp. GD03639]
MTASDPAVRVAAIQMVSTPDVARNLADAEALIAEAAGRGANLVALPEYFCFMGRSDREKVAIREREGHGQVQAFLAAQARRHGIYLAGGTLPLECPDPDRVYNTAFVYGPDGRTLARYDKIHLFNFRRGAESYDEAQSIRPGAAPVGFDAAWGRVGLSTCYDLRFPELYRALGQVDLILVPAAFTYTTGQAHWEILLRARAIENQCYVLAPAQGGTHPNGRRTWGHAMLVDPWGTVQSVLPEGPGVVDGLLDPARIAEVRAALPALRHRVL